MYWSYDSRPSVKRIFLQPQPEVTVRARKALERATRIILGPGDFYTNIFPNLLVRGAREAIVESDGETIFLVTFMTKRGETDGCRASDFVREPARYRGKKPDTVVVHTADHSPELLAQYSDAGAEPIVADTKAVQPLCNRATVGDFATEESLLRHDADKVIAALWPALTAGRENRERRLVDTAPQHPTPIDGRKHKHRAAGN
jgi:uncharacterized cofD-like protein